MPNLPDLLTPLVGQRPTWAFSILLVVHVSAGLTCVVTGAIAMLSKKRHGRHPLFGEIYYWSLFVVFVSMSGLAGLRWEHDAHLFALGTLSFGIATVGHAARRIRWDGWTSIHVLGMSMSYVVLLTAFYVDNGPHLPLWNRLPTIAFWVGPTLIGVPLIVRSLIRHTHFKSDVRATSRALSEVLVGQQASVRQAGS